MKRQKISVFSSKFLAFYLVLRNFEPRMRKTDRHILRIAIPAIVTNITVPLLGLVDTAIVGHMGDAAYIGAIAVGSMIFNLVYWIFGFLRMGTSGLTAQARGRHQLVEIRRLLAQSAFFSFAIAVLILLLQWPLRELMLWLVSPTPEVRPLAVAYFNIVVWGAPAMLGLYGITGWFIGMQNTRFPMFISIFQNVVNILASLSLVYGLGMKVEGVAIGTVIAQYAGLLVALGLLRKFYYRWLVGIDKNGRSEICKKDSMSSALQFFQVNRDIFLRTLFLVAVNLFFTSAGARQGAVILAVNTLLMQLYLLFSYIMDGFAYAGEALGGRYWGAKSMASFHDLVRRLFVWGIAMTILFTTVYVVGGMPFLHLLTDEPMVVEASGIYLWWAYLVPIVGMAAFIWDGVFIGMTQTRGMLTSSFIAAIVFFASVVIFIPLFGNHGLWLAMILYLLTRGIVQTVIFFRI